MKVARIQSVRFSTLLKSFGKPYSKTLWSDPGKDPELAKARKQNRVITVPRSHVGGKKDFGMVGFHPNKRGAFLIFPRSIDYPIGTKIIGIKWDLLAEEKVNNPIKWNQFSEIKHPAKGNDSIGLTKSPNRTRERASHPPKALHRFEATIRVVAEWEIKSSCEAGTTRKAKDLFKAQATEMDLAKAKIQRTIKAVTRVD